MERLFGRASPLPGQLGGAASHGKALHRSGSGRCMAEQSMLLLPLEAPVSVCSQVQHHMASRLWVCASAFVCSQLVDFGPFDRLDG